MAGVEGLAGFTPADEFRMQENLLLSFQPLRHLGVLVFVTGCTVRIFREVYIHWQPPNLSMSQHWGKINIAHKH
jgi:hypothetical protein